MDKRTAKSIPLQTFRDAFSDNSREITIAPLHKSKEQVVTGNFAAIYSDGRLLGLLAWHDLVMLIAETEGNQFYFIQMPANNPTDQDSELPPTVEQLVWNRQASLDSEKQFHLAEIADIEAELAGTTL